MPAVLFLGGEDPAGWIEEFARAAPDLDVRRWAERGDVADIDVVLGWRHPKGADKRYPNLKLISALGAGYEHILGDPERPKGVPVVRLIDEKLTQAMTEYVLLQVLRYHRDVPYYEQMQRERRWAKLPPPDTDARRVGILGLGALGQDAARRLVDLGFPVAGWSRSPKSVAGVEVFHGAAQLAAFAARTDILICLLPLNDEMRGIIDAGLLGAMPRGSYVINPARGGHVIDGDLIAALDSGQIAGATLDVFHTEPLPTVHPFWTHPKVTVTPHIASTTNARSSVPQIVENIRRVRAGRELLNRVDSPSPQRGEGSAR
jgi:glyoxylate/hydroxypyruvate reductase A